MFDAAKVMYPLHMVGADERHHPALAKESVPAGHGRSTVQTWAAYCCVFVFLGVGGLGGGGGGGFLGGFGLGGFVWGWWGT